MVKLAEFVEGDFMKKPPKKLILSIFPGLDLLGRGFENQKFCVVQAQDKITGGEIKKFHPPTGVFDGLIGGSPCQDFSLLNRNPTHYSKEMQAEYVRVVNEARPYWFLYENVATFPDFKVDGYFQQRFELNLSWFNGFSRLRHFIFGCIDEIYLNPMHRTNVESLGTAVTSKDERSFRQCCDIQGLPSDFELDSFNATGKKLAVANAVPLPMANYLGSLINETIYLSAPEPYDEEVNRLCMCGCGRRVLGRQKTHSVACRKRLSRARKK